MLRSRMNDGHARASDGNIAADLHSATQLSVQSMYRGPGPPARQAATGQPELRGVSRL